MNNSIEFSIDKKNFLTTLNKVRSVVENRNVMEILSNVKIDIEDNKMTLTATDMELSISQSVECKSVESGTLTVNAQKLFDTIKAYSSEKDIVVKGSVDSGKLQVKSGRSKTTLPVLSSGDFPLIERGYLQHNFEIQSCDFINLLNKTRFAMSIDESKYMLNGVSLNSLNDAFVAYSTDCHKLAKIICDVNVGDIPSIILPSKTLNVVLKIFEQSTLNLNVSLSENKIIISQDDICLVSKLIDATFPEVERIIPQDLTNLMEVDKQEFINAINRVSVSANIRTNDINLNVNDNELSLTTQNEDGLESQDVIDISSEIQNLKVKYNYKYLLEVLHNIDDEAIMFYFNSDNKPAYIRGISKENEIFVVMPMRG